MNAPPRLDLKVGFNCNNRCLFCVQGDKRDHVDDRTPEDIRSILEEHASTMSGVVFTGGEPTLRDDLVEHVRWAKELGFQRIQVQTNGRRVSYLPYMRALVEAGMSEISPALRGSSTGSAATCSWMRRTASQSMLAERPVSRSKRSCNARVMASVMDSPVAAARRRASSSVRVFLMLRAIGRILPRNASRSRPKAQSRPKPRSNSPAR